MRHLGKPGNMELLMKTKTMNHVGQRFVTKVEINFASWNRIISDRETKIGPHFRDNSTPEITPMTQLGKDLIKENT